MVMRHAVMHGLGTLALTRRHDAEQDVAEMQMLRLSFG